MPTKHIENTTSAPIYVGGKMIPPGTGRDIDMALLPPEHQVLAIEAADALPTLAELVEALRAKSVKDILAELGTLKQEALGLLLEGEKAQAKPRSSLVAALDAETIRRADLQLKAEEDALYLDQLLGLTPEQLAAVGEQISALTPAQLSMLTPEQRARMAPELLAALSDDQRAALGGTQPQG